MKLVGDGGDCGQGWGRDFTVNPFVAFDFELIKNSRTGDLKLLKHFIQM